MSQDTNDGAGGTLKTTERSLEVIETIRRENGARVLDLAEQLDLPQSTIHRHLTTLRELGYIRKDGDVYDLSLRFLRLGEYGRKRIPGSEIIQPKVKELAQESGKRVNFVVEEDGIGVYAFVESEGYPLNPGQGEGVYLHINSAGKAIMANLPEHRVEDIVDTRGLPSFTEHTITSADDLEQELADIRERGYAVNREEGLEGLAAVGVPVTKNDAIIGGLSMSGPVSEMTGTYLEDTVPDLLLRAAEEISLNIQYDLF